MTLAPLSLLTLAWGRHSDMTPKPTQARLTSCPSSLRQRWHATQICGQRPPHLPPPPSQTRKSCDQLSHATLGALACPLGASPSPGGYTWGHLARQDAQIPLSRWKQTLQIEESAQPILKMWSEHLRETDVQGHTAIPGCIGVQARRFSFCLSGLKKSRPLPKHLSHFCLLKTLLFRSQE